MHLRYFKTKGDTKSSPLRSEIILSKEEEPIWLKNSYDMVMNNTRWVLDNLETLPEFQVSTEDYHRKHYQREWKRAKQAKLKAEKAEIESKTSKIEVK